MFFQIFAFIQSSCSLLLCCHCKIWWDKYEEKGIPQSKITFARYSVQTKKPNPHLYQETLSSTRRSSRLFPYSAGHPPCLTEVTRHPFCQRVHLRKTLPAPTDSRCTFATDKSACKFLWMQVSFGRGAAKYTLIWFRRKSITVAFPDEGRELRSYPKRSFRQVQQWLLQMWKRKKNQCPFPFYLCKSLLAVRQSQHCWVLPVNLK